MRLWGAALGVFFLAGAIVRADGPGDAPSACYSYKEARARWPGAYLTWKYDEKKWQCWAPRGGSRETTGANSRVISARNRTPRNTPELTGAEDIAPEFPQPVDIKVNVPWPHPGGLGWVWETREPFEPRRIGDDMPVFSTFQPGEEPDVWPQMVTAGRTLPIPVVAGLMLFLAGGAFVVVAAVAVEASDSARSRIGRSLLDRIARARSYLPGYR